MSYTYIQPATISSNNSNTMALGGSATYTGGWDEVTNYGSISVIGASDQTGTLWVDFSTDSSNVARAIQLSAGNSGDFGIHSLIPIAKYFRVRVVNDTTPQGYMRLQTIYNPEGRIAQPTSRVDQTLTGYTDVMNSRAVLFGKTEGGSVYVPITAEGEGHLEVAISSPVSAFNEILTVNPTAVSQGDFVYGVNNRIFSNTRSNGTISSANSMVHVSTSANANSHAQITSDRYLKYRPGQGGKARYTALFTTGVAGSNQYAGLATAGQNNALMFGYNGNTFGIWHHNNGVRTHIPQTSWNTDKMNGVANTDNKSGMSLDPTKGNVYQIQYQYLGFGVITFAIENPTNGQITTVHEIKYPNAQTVPSLQQPSMSMMWRTENYTNDTNITLRGTSYGLFVEGDRKFLGPRNAFNNNKTGVSTETNIFTLRNATTYNGIPNRSLTQIRSVTFALNASGAATGIGTLRIVKNATLGGSPSYSTIDGTTADSGVTVVGDSTVSADTAGTTVSNGYTYYNAVVAQGDSVSVDLSDLNVYMLPGETLTFSANCSSSSTVGIGVVWNEDT